MFNNNFNPYGNGAGFMPNSMPTSTQPYGMPFSFPTQNPQGFSQQNAFNPNVQQQVQQQQNIPVQMNTNKVYVTGIEDAKTKQLAPNSDYIFLDNDKPLLYRKVVDATGKMDIQTFEIVPYTEKNKNEKQDIDLSMFVSTDDFNALKNDLERIKAYLNKNTQTRQNQPTKSKLESHTSLDVESNQ